MKLHKFFLSLFLALGLAVNAGQAADLDQYQEIVVPKEILEDEGEQKTSSVYDFLSRHKERLILTMLIAGFGAYGLAVRGEKKATTAVAPVPVQDASSVMSTTAPAFPTLGFSDKVGRTIYSDAGYKISSLDYLFGLDAGSAGFTPELNTTFELGEIAPVKRTGGSWILGKVTNIEKQNELVISYKLDANIFYKNIPKSKVGEQLKKVPQTISQGDPSLL